MNKTMLALILTLGITPYYHLDRFPNARPRVETQRPTERLTPPVRLDEKRDRQAETDAAGAEWINQPSPVPAYRRGELYFK